MRSFQITLRNGVSAAPLITAVASGVLVMSLCISWSNRDLADWSKSEIDSIAQRSDSYSQWEEPIQPVIANRSLNPKSVALGRMLFHEKKLSGDGTIACASCHSLEKWGTDRSVGSTGVRGIIGDVNAPTVFNAGLNYSQFWDGRVDSLERQVDGPLTSPKEMNSSWETTLEFLSSSNSYKAAFDEAFNSAPTPDLVRKSIADYERSLTTTNSPFDRWLLGSETAIDDQAKHGYELFKSYRCISCHQGPNVGGNSFQRLGVMQRFFETNDQISSVDDGRFNVTGVEADRHVFRVPPLRNVAETYPYFHDGSVTSLREAVTTMIRYQLGRKIIDEDVDAIVAFLGTLSGELSDEVVQ